MRRDATPRCLYFGELGQGLLDFGLGVDHVLAHHRIVLFELELVWSRALVLVGGVVVTSTGTGNEFDLLSPLLPLSYTFSPRLRISANT